MTNPATNTQKFTVGYRKWVLWLIISFDVAVILGVAIAAMLPITRIAEQNPSPDMWGQIGLLVFFVGLGLFMLAHLSVMISEIRRDGNVIEISAAGLYLWRVTQGPIPWCDITGIQVFDLGSQSRRICVDVKNKKRYDNSPYASIRLLRLIDLNFLTDDITMFFDGTACSNAVLREQIDFFWEQYQDEP